MLKRILQCFEIPYKKYFLTQVKCFSLLIIYTLLSIIFPGIIGMIIDKGIVLKNISMIYKYSILILFIGIAMLIFNYFQNNSFHKLGIELIQDFKENIFNKLCKTRPGFWDKNSVGDALTVLNNDIAKINEFLTIWLSQVVMNVTLFVGISIYILKLNLRIGLILIIAAFFFAFIQRSYAEKVKNYMKDFRIKEGQVNSYSNDILNNLISLQLIDYVASGRKVYNEANKKTLWANYKFLKSVQISGLIGGIFSVLAIFLVLLLGTTSVYLGNMSIGVLVNLVLYAQRLYGPLIKLGDSFIKYRSISPIIDRISNIISSEEEISSGSLYFKRDISGNIDFRDITFYYNVNQPIFTNFNLTIKKNEIIGIIGENGSGKSTILKLVRKICIPNSGNIYIDDIELSKFSNEYLKEQIVIMPQNNFMTEQEISKVILNSKSSDIWEEILELFNMDIETLFTQNSNQYKYAVTNKSGGELQKLLFTKTILHSKNIIILDEPSSSLDIYSEIKMVELIKLISKNKTIIIITHRTPLLDICDKVINLDDL